MATLGMRVRVGMEAAARVGCEGEGEDGGGGEDGVRGWAEGVQVRAKRGWG